MRLPLIAARGFESHPLRHMKIKSCTLCKTFSFAQGGDRGVIFYLYNKEDYYTIEL